MECFYLIHECSKNKFRVYLNQSNKDLAGKFIEINRNELTLRKFVLILEAVKTNVSNKSQYNWEASLSNGEVYAIKIDQHRFYTLQIKNQGYKELYICRYGKKESQGNTKKLTDTIYTIESIQIQKMLGYE